ncbi:MAG: M16 family metallopeptidase [Rhizobiaceae bacterium]
MLDALISRARCAAAAATIAFSFLGAAAHAQEAPDKAPEITSFSLANGMQVVVIPDHRAPIVTHMVWYKVGSADEPPGKSGIAHFFEHLMFKGTSNHPAGEFGRRVAEIGGNENAFTSYDYTAYFQTVAPEALKTMMEFESDRMRNLTLTDEVIGPERDVVLEERRSRIENNPQSLLGEEISATLYQNHPYRIPVIGWMHEMEQLNRTDATDFYERYYRPNNAILVVAGDVEEAQVRKLAEETYGKLERGPELPPRTRPREPEQNTARTVTLRDPRISVPSFQRSWVVPSYHTARDGEAEALDLLGEILGGGFRSRIYQALVVKSPLASSAGAGYSGTALDDTSFSIYGSPRGEASLDEVEKAIDAEIARLIKDGIPDKELEQAKKRYLRSMIFARDNAGGMANLYGSALATGGTVADVQSWTDRIQLTTARQVQDVARKYLDKRRSVTGYLLPPETAAN